MTDTRYFFAKNPENNVFGFYTTNFRTVESMPPDAVEITADEYQLLLEQQGEGKLIQADANGVPQAVDAPGPSADAQRAYIDSQITALERKQARPLRELSIAQAADPVNADTVNAALGRVHDIDAQIATLRTQRSAIG